MLEIGTGSGYQAAILADSSNDPHFFSNPFDIRFEEGQGFGHELGSVSSAWIRARVKKATAKPIVKNVPLV